MAVRVRGVSPFRGPLPGRLARWPLPPDEAAERAAAVPAERLPDVGEQFSAVEKGGGVRRLARIALPGATRPDPQIVGPPGPPS